MKTRVLIIVGFFLTMSVSGWAAKQPLSGALTGTVFNEGMKTPLNTIVIRIINVVTGQEYRSESSMPNGAFTVSGIEEGRYLVGIVTAAGEFSLGRGILIKGSEIGRLDLWLKNGSENRQSSLEPVLQPGGGTVTTTCWDWWEWILRWFRSHHGCWFSDDY